jgi:hypothetical protein
VVSVSQLWACDGSRAFNTIWCIARSSEMDQR